MFKAFRVGCMGFVPVHEDAADGVLLDPPSIRRVSNGGKLIKE